MTQVLKLNPMAKTEIKDAQAILDRGGLSTYLVVSASVPNDSLELDFDHLLPAHWPYWFEKVFSYVVTGNDGLNFAATVSELMEKDIDYDEAETRFYLSTLSHGTTSVLAMCQSAADRIAGEGSDTLGLEFLESIRGYLRSISALKSDIEVADSFNHQSRKRVLRTFRDLIELRHFFALKREDYKIKDWNNQDEFDDAVIEKDGISNWYADIADAVTFSILTFGYIFPDWFADRPEVPMDDSGFDAAVFATIDLPSFLSGGDLERFDGLSDICFVEDARRRLIEALTLSQVSVSA